MKSLGAKWLEELHNYLLKNKSLAMNDFNAAGITDAVKLPEQLAIALSYCTILQVKFIIHFNYNHDSL